MSRLNFVDLGPWPQGQDTYHDRRHAVFQPGERVGRLFSAVNFDLDDMGRVTRRKDFSTLAAVSVGLNTFSAYGHLLVQDGASIFRVDEKTGQGTEIVMGLDPTKLVVFYPFAGSIWWTNGVDCGAVMPDGSPTNWGMAAAEKPTLSPAAGALPIGRYLVSCTFVDATGAESGTRDSALIELATPAGISVGLDSLDINATHVNVYVTRTDQDQLFWVKQVAVGAMPTVVDDVRVSTNPLRTQHFRGPIPSEGIFSFMNYLMTHRENAVIRGAGFSPHLFDLRQSTQAFPHRVTGAAGLEGGLWVATEGGLWFIADELPENWAPMRKDDRKYARGGTVMSGSLIPRLETAALVAMFISEDGPVAGLPDGSMVPLTQDRLPLDVYGKRASIGHRVVNSTRQVVFALDAEPIYYVRNAGEIVTNNGHPVSHTE